MPTAVCDGIETRYEVLGDGPPLLMLSPGGFNATIENWREFGIYARLGLLDELPRHFSCVVFDKRESGASGGRLERLTWHAYAAQGAALLDHLGIERAAVMGGCIGCSIALALAVEQPERVERLVLYSPAGGPRYRMTQHARFGEHLRFVAEHGLAAVVELARESEQTFAQDPRLGPWVSLLRIRGAFAKDYAELDPAAYRAVAADSRDGLFDRDTVPGPPPELLTALPQPALIAPGDDASHALSAAHYLRECLPNAELWDALPPEQTDETAPRSVLAFLQQ